MFIYYYSIVGKSVLTMQASQKVAFQNSLWKKIRDQMQTRHFIKQVGGARILDRIFWDL